MNFTPKNPAFADMIRGKLHGQHFMNFIGFELTKIEAGLVEGQMPIVENIKQQTGFVHGGATATFADLVMGFAAYSLVREDQVVFTADLRISYLNPGIGQQVWAKGWVIKPGQKLIFCEAEIWVSRERGDGSGKLEEGRGENGEGMESNQLPPVGAGFTPAQDNRKEAGSNQLPPPFSPPLGSGGKDGILIAKASSTMAVVNLSEL